MFRLISARGDLGDAVVSRLWPIGAERSVTKSGFELQEGGIWEGEGTQERKKGNLYAVV
jgi:hypothetical protein